MTAREFFYKVKAMREAQQRYFKFRTSDELAKAKKLEREVDAYIAGVPVEEEGTDNGYVQLKLFE